MSRLWTYESIPGIPAISPARWPGSGRVPLLPGRATLIMLAHPRCPCTRASIGELALIMAHSRYPLTAYVFFYKPRNASAGWEQTDLYSSAAAIPGVHAIVDEGGTEAKRFHATTSGQTLLYDGDGHLLFSGGITASRGHAGDNAGREAILALLNGQKTRFTHTPVFGCSLLGPEPQ